MISPRPRFLRKLDLIISSRFIQLRHFSIAGKFFIGARSHKKANFRNYFTKNLPRYHIGCKNMRDMIVFCKKISILDIIYSTIDRGYQIKRT